ncbi:FeoB small GTPase domain-containing protein [Inediibacterium massiliense]|uniref:FeoB small GTPase domain-containing protein n=1 Tax=Inediibacterium massiliense TaxID=1658111 RepID=UPI0006B69E18|nr:FeoB small GTPase domain-containing protein [Inediibacterium massiliense]
MGSNCKSCEKCILHEKFNIKAQQDEFIIALAGNPNVGKSTVFNALTGLKQHTGNWPGKTVSNARGNYTYKDKKFILVDLPGTYSLLSNSIEEEVARDFICFGKPNATIVVADATCLERNLNLVLQVMELTDKVILCINLMDEAKRKGIFIDSHGLQKNLGIPVITTSARCGEGLKDLTDAVYHMALGNTLTKPKKIIYEEKIEIEVQKLIPRLKPILNNRLDARWVALKLIEGDLTILHSIQKFLYDEISLDSQTEVACFYE